MIIRIAFLCIALSPLMACSSPPAVGREPDEYVGCSTDENWATFDDVPDTVSDSEAPTVTAPTSGALPSTPVNFTWRQSSVAAGVAMGDVASTCEQWSTGFTTLHLPPVSGTVYDLQISSGGVVKHRVITTLQKWTASAADWSVLHGQAVEVKIRRMVLLNNDRKDGPFVSGKPFTATVSN